MRVFLLVLATLALVGMPACAADAPAPADPAPSDVLPSWRAGKVRDAILAWLDAVTDPAWPDFIPVAERVAVFDHDGTSWCERPANASTAFQVGLARGFAERGEADPEAMPLRAWLANDRDALRACGWTKAYEGLNAVFARMPVTAYRDSARAWVERTRHERFDARPTELYYVPMLELMRLLEAREFQVWIVTGSAQDFVRSFSAAAAGIPPERVIGSWVTPAYVQNDDGTVTIVRGTQETDNGYERKPANIETRIGRRPVFAAGNSNNDEPMCRYAVTGPRRGLAVWIRHDDGEREYDYGRPGRIGELCEESPAAHMVSMKRDWARVFAIEGAE